MNACDDMALLVQAELDGELDAAGAAALATHIAACPGCAKLQMDLATLSTTLQKATRHQAPLALRRAIQPPRGRPWREALAFGAGMALAASIAAFMVLPRETMPDVVAAHIRALQPGHLVDVASSDQHTVKPWFDGRLDFSPPVRDFAAQGFPLVGARLDYAAARPVAVLVYRRDRHVIDVFVWPGTHPGPDTTIQGYNVESWTTGDLVFRAVTDLNTTELRDLVRLLRS